MFSIEGNIIKTEDVQLDAESLGGVGKVFFDFMKKNGAKIAQVSRLITSLAFEEVTGDIVFN